MKIVLVALVAALMPGSGVAAQETASPPAPQGSEQAGGGPCAVPDALLEGGETKRARRAYVVVLRKDPTAPCALAGLKRANAPTAPKPAASCAAADQLFDAGELAAARRAYAKVGAGEECASTGIAAVREVTRLCAQGKAWEAEGDDDKARKAYESAIAKSPQAPCATSGVSATAPSLLTRLADDVESVLEDVVDWIPRVLLALGLLALLLFLLLMAGYLKPIYKVLLKLPLVGALLSPRLSLEPLDDTALGDAKVGAPLTERIKERLQRLREEALQERPSDVSLDFGTSDEEFADIVAGNSGLANSLDKARETSDHTAIVAALLDILYAMLPVPRLAISGALDPPSCAGASATVSLEEGPRLAAVVAIAGPPLKEPATAESYMALADQAAVWIKYEVARELSDGDVDPDAAESYAHLREGIERHRAGDADTARAAFEEAARLYPANWAARLNLATSEARLGPGYLEAIETLRAALRDIERGAPGQPVGAYRDDPNYYRLAYQLVAQRAHAWLDSSSPDPRVPSPGSPERLRIESSVELLHATREQIAELDARAAARRRWRFWKRRGLSPRDRRLRTFLVGTVEPCAATLEAGMLVDDGDIVDAERYVEPLRRRAAADGAPLSHRALYNLACYEVTLAAASDEEQPFARALWDLHKAFRACSGVQRAELAAWAARDPSLFPLEADPVARPIFFSLVRRYALPLEAEPVQSSTA